MDQHSQTPTPNQPHAETAPAEPTSTVRHSKLPILGMHCATCANNLTKTLKAVPGVMEAAVNLATGVATVTYRHGAMGPPPSTIAPPTHDEAHHEDTTATTTMAEAALTSAPILVKAVRGAGFDVALAETAVTLAFPTPSHQDPAQVEQTMIRVREHVPGSVELHLKPGASTLRLIHIPGELELEPLSTELERNGLPSVADEMLRQKDTLIFDELTKASGQNQNLLQYERMKRRFWVSALLSIPVMLTHMIPGVMSLFPSHHAANLFMLLLTIPIQFWGGLPFLKGAVSGLKHRRADMNTLVSVGTLSAFTYSLIATILPIAGLATDDGATLPVYFETSAMIIVFVLLGQTLEARAKTKAGDAITRLMELQPPTATIMEPTGEKTVPVGEVELNQRILIKPGERIPVDCVVEADATMVDEASLTGESTPVEKEIGDRLFSGTINLTGGVVARVTGTGNSTALARIIKLVEEAQARKAPIQRLADRVAGVFVPVVLVIAALTLIVWSVVPAEPDMTRSLLNFVAVLVVACPCALGLATPTAVLAGTGRGAEMGIMIKSGEVLEITREITTVLFDKTGTLTMGAPMITMEDIYLTGTGATAGTHMDSEQPQQDRTELLILGAAAERRSEHPYGKAILQLAASQEGLGIPEPESFVAHAGNGVEAVVGGKKILLGNRRFLAGQGVNTEVFRDMIGEVASLGKTPLLIAVDGQVASILALTDPLKEGAVEAVTALKNLGLEVGMITGDNRRTANAVAAALGLDTDRVMADVLPADKAAQVVQLQQEPLPSGRRRVVAMVGDGINDAPALARAHVGIAMSTGTDVAMEAGGITLLGGDPRKVADAIKLSSKTVGTIKQNLGWAFIYNILAIPIAAGVLYPFTGILLNPVIAGAAMAFSSVSVVSNSLRLRYAMRREMRERQESAV